MKEIEGLLEGIPLIQYVAAGSCGVKYVSKGLEIVCCRPGKEEFTTLATDPLDNKVYQSSKCRFHRGCSDEQYAANKSSASKVPGARGTPKSLPRSMVANWEFTR